MFDSMGGGAYCTHTAKKIGGKGRRGRDSRENCALEKKNPTLTRPVRESQAQNDRMEEGGKNRPGTGKHLLQTDQRWERNDFSGK